MWNGSGVAINNNQILRMFCARATTHTLYFFRSHSKSNVCVCVFLPGIPLNGVENSIHMLRRMFCARVSFFTILPCLACAYANGMNLWRAVCNKCVIQKFFFVISTRIALLLVFVGTQFVSFHSNFQLFQFPVDLASRKQVSWFIVLSLDRQTFAMYLADADIPTATPNNNGMTQKKTTNCKLIDTYQSGPLISTYAHIVAFIRQPWVVVNFKRFTAFANFWEKMRQKYIVKLETEISKIQSFFLGAMCVCIHIDKKFGQSF